MQNTGSHAHGAGNAIEGPDVLERSTLKDGTKKTLDKRLFMQLLVFTGCGNAEELVKPIADAGIEAVVYLDANDPRGVGLLFMGEDPAIFTQSVRKLLNSGLFTALILKPEFTMLGRTYATGFEQDLEGWLLQNPRRNVFDENHRWAVWYPLRRKPEFETLSKDEQRAALMEHAKLGMSYGAADLAHDVRLACHGLDIHDNEFVIGVLAKDLHPISKLIQDMRKTTQTSKYIQSLGPFFVGKAFYRNQIK
jgi:chlorite dismutase